MPVATTRLEQLQIIKLLQCVRLEDRPQIEKMTIQGIPSLINYSEPNQGESVLHLAAVTNNDELVRFLLGLGAHPNVQDFEGRTPVMRAAEYGHDTTMEVLAKAGADMKIVDKNGRGILFYCICPTQRHTHCLEIALQHGAPVNNKAHDGKPVLTVACSTATENEEMCIKLLEKGADPNIKHELMGTTPLMEAAGAGSAAVVRCILQKGGDVNAVDRKGHHAAHRAATGGFFDVLKVMAAFGANFNQVASDGNTPIHYAARGGHDSSCKFLAQRGCPPKLKNSDGMTPRAIAKEAGSKAAGKELRKAENAFTKYSKPGMKNPNAPWMVFLYDWCVERQDDLIAEFSNLYTGDDEKDYKVNKEDFVQVLKKLKAPIPDDDHMKKLLTEHDKTREGVIDTKVFLSGKQLLSKTYLMSSYEPKSKKKKKGGKKGRKKGGKTKIYVPICTLPEGPRMPGGAPPAHLIPRATHWTDTGRFDRDHPPQHPLQDDSWWYLQHPQKTYINISEAAKLGDIESLKQAFQNNYPIDTRDKYFKTPLMCAAAHGHIEITKYLIEMGASVNAVDNFRWTPLHHACHGGQVDVVTTLVSAGADIDAQTMNGATPLMRAIECSNEPIVSFLIDQGVNMRKENKKEHNALDTAKEWADPRVLSIVQAKFDSLPAPKKKKKGGRAAKKSPAATRPQTVPPIPFGKGDGPDGGKKSPDQSKVKDLVPEFMPPLQTPPRSADRRSSVIRVQSSMAGRVEDREDIQYEPKKVWAHQPTKDELLQRKETDRTRWGYELDFPNYKPPFQKNIASKVELFGGPED
ncbi:ANKEF1 [Branchiostoma lanceolatum]|uniref:ANKEF1 protein n=1 Tax=Branchiostoma lanceolatum TaxID=7740 RepID=A0A8K0ESP9_BRALA|nr:ANKEF1 [Branchiostoma lanceolatum]